MLTENLSIIITFALYLIFMLAIGGYFYRKTNNLSDYVLGGRSLNSWVTSMSAQASDMSGWLLLGLPGYVYLSGFEAIWLIFGLMIGTYLNWKFIAKRLRLFTELANDSITLPDYFENRFADNSHLLRIVSAIFILIFFLIYTASGFVAGAKLFNTVFDINYTYALIVGVIVIISYTFLGGFNAVSWTDFFQGLLMLFAIVIIPIIGIFTIGGIDITFNTINNINPALLDPLVDVDNQPLSLLTLISLLAWGLGYFGQPHILSRFMAITSPTAVKTSRRIAMIWVIFSLIGAMFVGLVGRAYFSEPLADSEQVFMLLVNVLTHPWIAGVLLAAILAAVMSTADSQLLVTASSLTQDFYKVLLRKNASQKELILISRLTVLGVALIAFFIALDPNSSVLALVAYAWAGFGAAFGPLVILSLFWEKMTAKGALAGIITGGLTVILWKQFSGGIFDVYELAPGFLCAFFAIFLVSKLDGNPPQSVSILFQHYRNQL